jgi:hypothetical protein
VAGVTLRTADPEERKRLHRLGNDVAIASMALTGGDTLEVVAAGEDRAALQGPYAIVTEPT